MMCEAARMLLDAYLDNQLSPLQRGKVDEHLRECRACARIVDENRGYHACLEAYYAFVKPSDSLVESALYNLADAEIGKKRTATDLKSKSSSHSGTKLEPPAPRRRNRGLVAAIAFLFLAAAGFAVWRLASGPASVGRIEAATGTVERRGAGAPLFEPAPAGTALAAGDVVRAAAGGSASVSAPPVRMELAAASVATIRGESADSRFEVSVDQGSASIEAVRGEGKVVIASPAARATVSESKDYVAEVAVEVRPGETVFTVKRGTFLVAGGGEEVVVAEGRRTVVKPGRPPSPAEAPGSPPPSPPDRKPPARDADAAEPPVVQAARRGEADCLAAVLASPTLGRAELPAVLRWVEKQKRPEDVRPGATALAAIARSVPGNAPDAVAALSRIASGDSSAENRAAAVEALAAVPGATALKALEAVASRDKDAAVARRAATALALRDDGKDASAALLEILKGPADASVKREAAKGALFADPAAASAALGAELPAELLAEAEKGLIGLAAAIRLARDPVVRFQILARVETAAAGAEAADAGFAALGDELAAVAQSDANPILRRRAALSLGAIPKAASAAAGTALEAARSDRDESVKVAAALAHLKREGKDGGGVAAASLYQQLRSAEQKLALAAGLTRALPAEAAAALLQKIAEGERVPPLKAAVDALRRSLAAPGGGAGTRTTPETESGDPIPGLDHEDPAVRARSVAALARRGADDAAAREAIFRAFEDAEETVRAAAVAAASKYKDDEAFEALRGLLARDPSAAVRGAALPIVAAFSQREDLSEVLGTALAEEPDEEIRAKIVQSLTRAPGQPATEALVRALSQDGSPLVQSAVVRALGSRKERDAGQALVDALGSPDPAAVADVVAALRQFSGQSFPFDANGEPDQREVELAAIREWWAANGDSYP